MQQGHQQTQHQHVIVVLLHLFPTSEESYSFIVFVTHHALPTLTHEYNPHNIILIENRTQNALVTEGRR